MKDGFLILILIVLVLGLLINFSMTFALAKQIKSSTARSLPGPAAGTPMTDWEVTGWKGGILSSTHFGSRSHNLLFLSAGCSACTEILENLTNGSSLDAEGETAIIWSGPLDGVPEKHFESLHESFPIGVDSSELNNLSQRIGLEYSPSLVSITNEGIISNHRVAAAI